MVNVLYSHTDVCPKNVYYFGKDTRIREHVRDRHVSLQVVCLAKACDMCPAIALAIDDSLSDLPRALCIQQLAERPDDILRQRVFLQYAVAECTDRPKSRTSACMHLSPKEQMAPR